MPLEHTGFLLRNTVPGAVEGINISLENTRRGKMLLSKEEPINGAGDKGGFLKRDDEDSAWSEEKRPVDRPNMETPNGILDGPGGGSSSSRRKN